MSRETLWFTPESQYGFSRVQSSRIQQSTFFGIYSRSRMLHHMRITFVTKGLTILGNNLGSFILRLQQEDFTDQQVLIIIIFCLFGDGASKLFMRTFFLVRKRQVEWVLADKKKILNLCYCLVRTLISLFKLVDFFSGAQHNQYLTFVNIDSFSPMRGKVYMRYDTIEELYFFLFVQRNDARAVFKENKVWNKIQNVLFFNN